MMSPDGVPGAAIAVVKLCCLVLYILLMVVVWPITQLIVSKTSIALPYSAMYPCSTPHAMLENEASIHLPGPFSAVLNPYETMLTVDGVDGAGRAMKINLGKSTFPKMSLSAGSNNVDFTVAVDIADSTVLLQNFLLPMFMEGKEVKLYLDVPKMSLKVFGLLPVPMLHMHKVLKCHGSKTVEPKEVPESICHPTAAMDSAFQEGESEDETQDVAQLISRRLQLSAEIQSKFKGYVMICVDDKTQGSLQVVV
jgi:hypothetical protein